MSAIPNGILPYWLAVLGYMLFYYCALLAVGLLWDSSGAHATAIIVGNVSINFLIPFLLGLPSVAGNAKGPTAVWTGDIVAILSAEIRGRRSGAGPRRLLPIAHAQTSFKGVRMSTDDRLHALDAVRAFALLLGVLFHAGFSFIPGMIPGIWAINDSSPSVTISVLLFASHIFRMSLFFFIAGFFARMMFQRKGARGFWANRAKRILVPLIVGWVVIFPTLAAVWIWGLTKTFGTLPAAPAGAPPAPPGAFPLTHLWFLYYLLVLYAIVLLCRAIVVRLDRRGSIRGFADAVIRGAARSRTAAVVLALPVGIALYLRGDWVIWFGIPTPDHSLIPEITSLVCFGTAFVFGWLVHRQVDLLQVWKKQWAMHLAVALGATAVCVRIAGATPSFVPASPGLEKLAFAFCYGLAIWCWSFAVIGSAMRFLAHASDRVRYVADASFWIYLVHLPVVAVMQVLVGHLPWHWSVKFPLILVVSLAVLFSELSHPRASDLHRAAAERPQVSARRPWPRRRRAWSPCPDRIRDRRRIRGSRCDNTRFEDGQRVRRLAERRAQALRQDGGARRPRSERAARRAPRRARTERRGEVHGGCLVARTPRARRG